MRNNNLVFVALLAAVVLPASLVGQPSNGTVTAGSVSGAPGDKVNIPITFVLTKGGTVDALVFGLMITPGAGAPALSGLLKFTSAATLPAPSVTDNGLTPQPNIISVGWTSGLSIPAGTTTILGTIAMTIPAAARDQQTYGVQITGGSASSAGVLVPFTPGPDGTVTVAVVGTPPSLLVTPTSLTFAAQAGGASQPGQPIFISNSGSGTLSWTAIVTSGSPWLKVAPGSASGGGLATASVDITGLGVGSYTGAIQISATGATNSPQTVAVTLNISPAALPPALAANPTTLTFAAQAGGANPASQSVAISNTGGGTLTWNATVTAGSWLRVTPTTGTNSGTLSVSANIATLTAGVYVGTIQVAAAGVTGSPQTINVTLTISSAPVPPAIALNPTALTFAGQVGGANPGSQSVAVSNAGGGTLSWTASVASGAWLSVSPASGSNNGTLTIGVNLAGLNAGTLTGSIRVTAAGASNTPVTLPVTLTIVPVAGTDILLSPAALQFSAASGTGAVPAQTFQVLNNAGSGALGWTAAVTTQSGGNWLSVTPSTGVAPSTLIVSVGTSGLAQGVYQGAITITALASANAVNSPQTLPVTLTIDAPTIVPNGIVNGASFSTNAVVSPGSIVSLFGLTLATRTESATGLPLPTTLGGAQVLVLGKYAAPLFYASPGQINFQLPFEAATSGTSVPVVVISAGITSPVANVTISPAVPGIFSTNSSGLGQAAALNQDFSTNSTQNPAAAGSVIQIFATGLGVTNPPVTTGQIGASQQPLNQTLVLPIVTIGGSAATVVYSGLAPGFVGLYQVNAIIPQGLSGAQSLQIQANGQSSNTTTIAVR